MLRQLRGREENRNEYISGPRNTSAIQLRALTVLFSQLRNLSQVLINDQSSRGCAQGDLAACPAEIVGEKAGWPRFTSFPDHPHHGHLSSLTHAKKLASADLTGRSDSSYEPPVSYRHGQRPCIAGDSDFCSDAIMYGDEVNKNSTAHSSSYAHVKGGGGSGYAQGSGMDRVEYRLHEFGVMYPSHDFTFWPGFSLNPALWDLRRLNGSYRRKHGRPLDFNPTIVRY